MISFDISSLYTNVPVNETINILCNKAFSTGPTFSGFNESQFREMQSLIFDNTFFLFNDSLYKQTDGLDMGNPLAPALANIFLCNLEQQIFDNFALKYFELSCIVDTWMALLQYFQVNMIEANQFFNYINSAHPNIKFTMEKEHNNRLPFLDLLTHYRDSKFHSSIYRKPTFTGLAVIFFSCCPMKHKINSIKTLIHRAYYLSSNYQYFVTEIDYLKNFFYQ